MGFLFLLALPKKTEKVPGVFPKKPLYNVRPIKFRLSQVTNPAPEGCATFYDVSHHPLLSFLYRRIFEENGVTKMGGGRGRQF